VVMFLPKIESLGLIENAVFLTGMFAVFIVNSVFARKLEEGAKQLWYNVMGASIGMGLISLLPAIENTPIIK